MISFTQLIVGLAWLSFCASLCASPQWVESADDPGPVAALMGKSRFDQIFQQTQNESLPVKGDLAFYLSAPFQHSRTPPIVAAIAAPLLAGPGHPIQYPVGNFRLL
jgi:hypothetical protein